MGFGVEIYTSDVKIVALTLLIDLRKTIYVPKSESERYTLVICEKPDVAYRVANALDEGDLKQTTRGKMKVFNLKHRGRRYLICSALGHLYTVGDPDQKRHIYPIFDVEWYPVSTANKMMRPTSQRINTIRKIAAAADSFINACDFDLEGETIAHNILKYACGGKEEEAWRAKFSTLTEEELRTAFRAAQPGLGDGLAKAGRTRHVVDFIFGVNLSRALSESYYASNRRYRVVSVGRVQGPTLSFAVNREIEVRTFVSTPFWKISAELDKNGDRIGAAYEKPRLTQLTLVNKIKDICEGKNGLVTRIARSRFQQLPPTPFNIGDLQKEAFRIFGYSPSQTLSISERLYLDALISYPRTSSQKLPPSIDYQKIISGLQRNGKFSRDAGEVLKGRLTPHEGRKTDPAHPAIYPTGELAKRSLSSTGRSLYDLIVRRFLTVFGEAAVKEKVSASISIDCYVFNVFGQLTIKNGWQTYYKRYIQTEDRAMPNLTEGEVLPVHRILTEEKFTQPPSRYNQSSLLEKMEAEDIGTKATRAGIIKTLYDRKYLTGRHIIATDIAFSVVELMEKHSPSIISTGMTRRIEENLERIERGDISGEEVVEDAVDQLYESLAKIKQNEEAIGSEMTMNVINTLREMNRLGPCPKCKTGVLSVIRSKKTRKRFVGCSNYSDGCDASAPLPQKGTLSIPRRTCKNCGWPIVYIQLNRFRWQLCVNMECKSKRKKEARQREVLALRKRSDR
jgi:DNA topoisomerase-1